MWFWAKKYLYIFISVIFLLIYRIIFGFTFDEEKENTIKFNDIYYDHYLIHQICVYGMCIIVSLILRGEKKFEENLDLANNAAYLIKIGLSKPKKPTGFFVVDQNLIFREKYRNDDVKNSMFFIFIIISVYVVLEQINILFKKFFVHMYFWMVAILNSKIFKIQIFRNQKLALLIYFISVILNLIVVVLKIGEKKKKKHYM